MKRSRTANAGSKVVLTVLSLLVAACSISEGNRAVRFENRTSVPIVIVHFAADGTEVVLSSKIGPGQVGSHDWAAAGGCLPAGSVVARNLDGQQVARHAQPMCALETWIVRADGAPGTS